MRSAAWRRLVPYLLILPSLAVIGPILVYPLIYNVYLSFFEWDLISFNKYFVGFKNYIDLLNQSRFWTAVKVTGIFTVVSVLLQLAIGLCIALVLNQSIMFRRLMRSLVILPFVISPAVVGLIWRLIWDPDFGPLNTFLRTVGLEAPGWIADTSWALFSVIVTEVWLNSPFVGLVLLAGLQVLPRDPHEAAHVDGATRWQVFRYVTLPLMKPIIALVVMIQTVFTLRAFDTIWVLTGGGPANSTLTLSVLVYRNLFRYFDGGAASTVSVVILFVTLVVASFLFRGFSKEVDV